MSVVIDYDRFTACGRPLSKAPIVAAGGWSRGFAGASGILHVPDALPHRFTDESMILVPIRMADLEDPDIDFDAWWATIKKESAAKRRGLKSFVRNVLLRPPAGAKKGDFVTIEMSRADYLRYCAKDEKGAYIGTEPKSVSCEVLRDMITRQHGDRLSSTASAPSDVAQRMRLSYVQNPYERRPTYG